MFRKLKRQFQFIAAILTVLVIQTSIPIVVHAEDNPWGVTPGGDVDDNGTGTGTGGSSDLGTLGISQENSGYRVYLESAGGQVVDNYVIDLYFDNIPPSNIHAYPIGMGVFFVACLFVKYALCRNISFRIGNYNFAKK